MVSLTSVSELNSGQPLDGKILQLPLGSRLFSDDNIL
jgi:hypothetical protein